jgi:hypothetical protein
MGRSRLGKVGQPKASILYLPGGHRAQAQLGWRGPQRVKSDGYPEILGM